jgi:hypothetical protein
MQHIKHLGAVVERVKNMEKTKIERIKQQNEETKIKLESINKDNGIMLINKYKANIIIFLLNEIVGNRAKFSAEKFSKCRTFL